MRVFTHFLLPALLCATLAIASVAMRPVNAAQNPASQGIPTSNLELIVLEADHCLYCFIFRRDVAPGYLRSPRARAVPLRYVNMTNTDISSLRLKSPVTIVPTIVLMQNGEETDRIDGYMGPEPFYYMLSRLMK